MDYDVRELQAWARCEAPVPGGCHLRKRSPATGYYCKAHQQRASRGQDITVPIRERRKRHEPDV